MVMENSIFVLVLTILFSFCASINKLTNKAIHYAIAGQNEMIVSNGLGLPARTNPTPDGGKKLIYQYFTKGMFSTPCKSRVTYRTNKTPDKREGIILYGGVNTATYLSKIAVVSIHKAYVQLANIEMLNNNWELAEKHLDRWHKIQPGYEELYESFILLSLFQGDKETAKYFVNKCLANKPENDFVRDIKETFRNN